MASICVAKKSDAETRTFAPTTRNSKMTLDTTMTSEPSKFCTQQPEDLLVTGAGELSSVTAESQVAVIAC